MIVLAGPSGSGRSFRMRRAAELSSVPIHCISLRGLSRAEMVPLAVARHLGALSDHPRCLAWMLGRSNTGLVFDQADTLLASDFAAFRSLLADWYRAGVGPVAVVGLPDGDWNDWVSIDRMAVDPRPHGPMPAGMVPTDYADLVASNPAALEMSGPVFAFDPAWVRNALRNLASVPETDRVEAILDLLTELAVRRTGYLSHDAAAMFHLLCRLPTGMSRADRVAALGDAEAAAVEILERFHLVVLDNDRLHARHRVAPDSTPPLVDILQERWEERARNEVTRWSDALADGAVGPEALPVFDLENWTWLASHSVNPSTPTALSTSLPRLLAHAGCRTLARQVLEQWETQPDPGNRDGSKGWGRLLRADLARVESNPTESRDYASGALAIFRERHDIVGIVGAQHALAAASADLGDVDAAVDAAARALREATKAGWQDGQARSLQLLGTVSQGKGDPVAVRDAYLYAAGLFEELGNRHSDLECRIGAARCLQVGGWVPEAFDALVECLEQARAIGFNRVEAALLANLAELVRLSGDPHRAVLIADAALHAAAKIADPEAARAALRETRRSFSEFGYGEPALAALVVEGNLLETLGHADGRRMAKAVEQIRAEFKVGDGPDFLGGALGRADEVLEDAVDRVRSLVALWELPIESHPVDAEPSEPTTEDAG